MAAIAWAQPQPEPPTDLGARVVGQSYPFKLVAINRNCNLPQDFRFVVSGGDWLRIDGDPVARGVQRGEQRTVPARIDLTGRPPGIYTAHVTVICDTCQVLVFKTCRISDRNIDLRVQAVSPPQPAQPRPQPQPAKPKPPPAAAALPDATPYTDIDPDLLRRAPGAARAALAAAEERERQARAAADKAQKDLDDIRKKRGPCEEELAALRAAQGEAEAAAAAAAAAAQAAQGEADKAQQAVDSFAGEMAAAERKMSDAQKTLQQQAMYRSIVGRENGVGSAKYQDAQAQVDKANDAVNAAQAAYRALRASQAARAAAAAAAKANAAKANAAAQAAAAAAAKAAAATAAKEKECLGLAAAESDAEGAAARAAGEADGAADAARKAEDDARAAAILSLEEEIAAKRRHCDEMRAAARAHAQLQEQALKALQQLGALDPGAPTDGLDEIWDDYVGLGYTTFVNLVATGSGLVTPGAAPTAGGPQMLLSVLQAGYGIMAIRQSALTPGTYANLRDRMISGPDGSANQWVRTNGFADDKAGAEKVLNEMDRIMNDTGVIAKDMARAIEADRICQEELKALEARLAAAK
ncbi:hypothetical protein QO010_001978 [Caulobacter ginsengisoli]|uniref:Chromosome segregation ATPase n=1 Tax=Caulobacter ginsengisoli TaxID=400775 RepID=A0ABU0IQA2_9CAUL|nr:hypothetical protein [Caulobacter ginsengisoli]MDQ0464197.1 hypothetical protein [Caulobacter ginsengisoli]